MRGRCDRVDEEFVNSRLVADLQEHIYGAVEVHVYVVEVAYAARRLVRYFIRVYMCMAVYYHFFYISDVFVLFYARQLAFDRVVVYLAEREYRRVALQGVRKYFFEFCAGHGFVYPHYLFAVLAVETVHFARVRVKARGYERMYLVLFAYRAQQELGRRRAYDCGEVAVLRGEKTDISAFRSSPRIF